LLDHGLDLRPEVGIALALHVAGGEDAVPPRSFGALDVILFVIEEVVAQDFGPGGINGGDVATAVDDALSLIKIHGLGYVIRNEGIVLPEFGDTIDLDG